MRPYADTSETGADQMGGFGGSTPGERGDFFNAQCASIDSHVIDHAVEINFITGLIARANAQLPGVVDGLAAKRGKAVLGSTGLSIHVTCQGPGAVEDHRDVMPLAVIHGR